jgi:hypothetical protein
MDLKTLKRLAVEIVAVAKKNESCTDLLVLCKAIEDELEIARNSTRNHSNPVVLHIVGTTTTPSALSQTYDNPLQST